MRIDQPGDHGETIVSLDHRTLIGQANGVCRTQRNNATVPNVNCAARDYLILLVYGKQGRVTDGEFAGGHQRLGRYG